MSNIYIQEPPTEGKVLLVTSAGDIDIELWSKEAPKACRNFVQLCLENYYNGTIFHRVIPGFIAQGGDPSGSGSGGESVYGKPFRDEFHTRLRFVRRGLVAMANGGPNDNGSQFFFSLGPCPELQNKHTIFGKVSGNTIYNLPRFEEGEFNKEDRPEYPQKILSTEVLNNPFPDIVPRMAVEIENEVPKESKKKKGTKNFKLLSFGDEALEDEEEFVVATKKMPNKSNSAHDIAMDPTLSSHVDQSKERADALKRIRDKLTKEESEEKKKTEEMEVVLKDSAEANERASKEKTRSEIRAEIRKLKKELQGKTSVEGDNSSDEESNAKKQKISSVVEEYNKDMEKYAGEKKKIPLKGVSRESHTLALLQRFTSKVKDAWRRNESEPAEGEEEKEEIDEDESWLTHRLQFDENAPILAKDASTKDDHWYDLSDPRNALNKRRREEKSKPPRTKS